MKLTRAVFVVAYGGVALLFLGCGVALIGFAAVELWEAIHPASDLPVVERFSSVVDSIGVLAIAVVALELGQTVIEEEILREANVSGPTRVRRFLSRFLVVVVIALSVESLVAVFRLVHEDPSRLPHASMVAFSAAAILLAWGIFVRQNRSAEELEPEAMEMAKGEDQKVE